MIASRQAGTEAGARAITVVSAARVQLGCKDIAAALEIPWGDWWEQG
jgi:hypothetical protein